MLVIALVSAIALALGKVRAWDLSHVLARQLFLLVILLAL